MAPSSPSFSLASAHDLANDTITADQEGGIIIRGSEVEKPKKSIAHLQLLSASWNILNSWYGFAAVFILGLPHGGPVLLVWGMVFLALVYGAIGLSLAELAAHYPTAGGQYHWVYLLAPDSAIKRPASYACAVANIVGRISICASVVLYNAQNILGLIAFCDVDYQIQHWHVFVVYLAVNLAIFAYNAFILHRASWTHHVGCALSFLSFFVITITCLALANPKQPSSYVWTTFVNQSGWQSSAATFFIGLVCPNFALGGLDGPLHLSEETFDPARTVPLSIISSTIMGGITAVAFIVVMLYCITDIPGLTSSRTGIPVFEMWYQATQSSSVTIVFITLFTAIGLLVAVGSIATASRLTWSFARDNALVGSGLAKKIDKRQRIPVNALIYNAVWITVLGALYMGSSTAFNSFVGIGVLVEQISFAFPIAFLLWRRRASKYLPPPGHFNMGRMGWLYNGVTVVWTAFALVVYCLPPDLPVTPGNMNYTSIVLVIVALLAAMNWTLYANRHYKGPKVLLLASH